MNWVILPLLIPALTALLLLFMGSPSPLRRSAAALSLILQLGVAFFLVYWTYHHGPVSTHLGGWSAPYGIVLVVDLLAAVMISISCIIALASILFGFAEMPVRLENPLRLPLFMFLLLGVHHSFLTGDLFNLFVAFEVMLLSSYALLTLEADDWDIREAFPYLAINLFGSFLFLSGAAFAYGLFGTLNFAEISLIVGGMTDDPRVLTLGILFLVVFGIKAGMFPLYFWLPNSYPTLPIPLAAFFGGMLTKVGVYVLMRLFGTILPPEFTGLHTLLCWLAAATMFFGVLGAVSRNFIRGILAFHILSQIGFMLLAIGLYTEYSMGAALFYNLHNNIVKASLFLAAGVAIIINRTDDLAKMGHLWRAVPLLGLFFLLQALSLAGLPPLSGFWGKYMIVVAGMEKGAWVLVAVSLLTGVLTLLSMLKIWMKAYWSEGEGVEIRKGDNRLVPLLVVLGGMTLVSLTIGLGAEFFLEICLEAGSQLMNRQAYIEHVLPLSPP